MDQADKTESNGFLTSSSEEMTRHHILPNGSTLCLLLSILARKKSFLKLIKTLDLTLCLPEVKETEEHEPHEDAINKIQSVENLNKLQGEKEGGIIYRIKVT